MQDHSRVSWNILGAAMIRTWKRRLQKEYGAALVAALISLVILMGLVMGLMAMSISQAKVSEAGYQLDRTLYIAEAGVDAAAFNLLVAQDGILEEDFGGGYYIVNSYNLLENNGLDDDGDGEIDEASETDAEGNLIFRVVSVGHLNEYEQAIEVDVKVFLGAGWDYAALVRHEINMGGNCQTNSYNSSQVDYPEEQLLGNGDVGTISTGLGIVDVSGSATINGDARCGFGGNPPSDINVTGSADITGEEEALDTEIEIPSVEVPDLDYDEVGNIILTGHQARTLEPGNYYVPALDLSASSELNLGVGYEGEINILVDDFTVRGSAQINIPGNIYVSMYVTNSLWITANATEINDPNATDIHSTPSNLTIYGTPTLSQATFTGNSNIFAIIYAPDTDITIIGNTRLMGAIVSSSLYVGRGNARFYLDESIVLDMIDVSHPVGLRGVSWREIAVP